MGGSYIYVDPEQCKNHVITIFKTQGFKNLFILMAQKTKSLKNEASSVVYKNN